MCDSSKLNSGNIDHPSKLVYQFSRMCFTHGLDILQLLSLWFCLNRMIGSFVAIQILDMQIFSIKMLEYSIRSPLEITGLTIMQASVFLGTKVPRNTGTQIHDCHKFLKLVQEGEMVRGGKSHPPWFEPYSLCNNFQLFSQFQSADNSQSSRKLIYIFQALYSGADSAEDECSVCLTNRASCAILPCRHRCACDSCITRLTHCPMCRSTISSYFNTSYPDPTRKADS